jgi:DNA-directed RNA polymerase subunit RPC12/RpoP
MSKLDNCVSCITSVAKSVTAFHMDDNKWFFTYICLTCEDGIIPSYLNEDQVIRFLKVACKRNNIKIVYKDETTWNNRRT